jgi:hypothetical protein
MVQTKPKIKTPKPIPPNPLPCGCGMMGTRDINRDCQVVYRERFIHFCSLHRMAPRLLEIVRQFEKDGHAGGCTCSCLLCVEARTALRIAEDGEERPCSNS